MKRVAMKFNWVLSAAFIVAAPSVGSAADLEQRTVADWIGQARQDVSRPAPPTQGTFGPGGVAAGRSWLESNQNPDGSWGSTFPLIESSTVLQTLTTLDSCGPNVGASAAWLAEQDAANHEFLARQIAALAGAPGFEVQTATLVDELFTLRNLTTPDTALPNWPEGGWGIEAGFESDSLTTALSMLALDRTGFNGGFQVTGATVEAVTTDIHQFFVPDDALKVRILITVSGAEIRLRMTEGAPPGPGDPFFPLLGGPFLITFPDSGLPFTPGTNFITIENPTGATATYTMTVSYETPTFNTTSLAEPLNYLRQAQNVDGGWGLQRGQASETFTTLHVLLALLRYAPYEFDTEIASGLAFLTPQQLGDGSFGLGAGGLPYATALAALDLIRSETPPFSTEAEDAIAYLVTNQSIDGSWLQEPYDTALATLALWEHDLPPVANAGTDIVAADIGEDCTEGVMLSGSGTSPDGTIVSYSWREDCVPIASGATPTVVLSTGVHQLLLTVTADDGQTASDTVRVEVVSSELDQDFDGFLNCGGDCDDNNVLAWSTPDEVPNLVFSDKVTLTWQLPANPGASLPVFDLLRSGDPADFVGATICVESDDGSDTSAQDLVEPASGSAFFYLARAVNDCPIGDGSLGNNSEGVPRAGSACP